MLLSSNGRHRATPARRTATQRLLAGAGIASVVGMAFPLAAATSAVAAPSSSSSTPAATTAAATASTPGAAVTAEPTSASTTRRATHAASYYTVQAGDWLSTIAQREHVRGGWERLYAINRSTLTQGPDLIYPGERLVLNGTVVASSTTTAPAATTSTTSSSSSSTSAPVTTASTVTSNAANAAANAAASAAAQAAYNAAVSANAAAAANASGSSSDSASGSTSAPSTPASNSGSGTTASSSTPAASGSMAAAISFAEAQLGKEYVYGGTGPDTWDCSGLTQAALAAAGISIPRTSEEQAAAATPVSMNALEPGDLLFWSTDGTAANAYHVAIYIGNGSYVEAANPSTGVVTDTISDYTPTFAGRF
jgi:resuscitation-promoting factor RpfA